MVSYYNRNPQPPHHSKPITRKPLPPLPPLPSQKHEISQYIKKPLPEVKKYTNARMSEGGRFYLKENGGRWRNAGSLIV